MGWVGGYVGRGGGGVEKTMAFRNASGQVGIHTYPLTTSKGVVASVAELLMHVFMSLAACKPRHIRALPAQEPEAGLVSRAQHVITNIRAARPPESYRKEAR